MENLSAAQPNETPEPRVLRFTTITPDTAPGSNEQAPTAIMSVEEVMGKFVLGAGLTARDKVIIDNRDVIEELPRPEKYGTVTLALMSRLDAMPSESNMTLEIEEASQAAD